MTMDSSRSDNNNDNPLPDLKLAALFKNHWTDWIFIIVLIILWGVCHIVTPFQRYVGAENFATQSIIYPYKDNTIPFQIMPVFALVIPFIFIFIHFCYRRKVHDLHHAFLGLLTTVALTAVITDAVKVGIGRPRPHFYARCFGSTTAKPNYDASGNVVCATAPSLMKEAYKSFPSGHTSWAFAGMGYLAMYLGGKIGIFDHKGHSWKLFPVVLPILVATFVAITRVDDYWHHWTDVCAGAATGLLSAYFCYRQHFPSLFDDNPHAPYDSSGSITQSQSASHEGSQERQNDLERGGSQIPML